MTELQRIVLVISREVRQRIRTRAFLITTVLLVVLIVAGGVIRSAVGDSSTSAPITLLVVGTEPSGLTTLLDQSRAGGRQFAVSAASIDVARAALASGRADVVLDAEHGALITRSLPDQVVTAIVEAAWRQSKGADAAASAGLDPGQTSAILDPPALTLVRLNPPKSDDSLGTLTGFLTAVLLFLMISQFGGLTLAGVIEEKSTGVVEVLLAQVKARSLLIGKVLGIGIVALSQFLAALIAGVVSLKISGVVVPGAVWQALPASLGWFVGGYLLYATLFALAGSFVSRQEDAQAALAPITTVFLMAYLAVFVVGSNPGGTPARVMSVLPPFAPLLMPLRIATAKAAVGEVALAAVLLAAAVWGMFTLAAKVYSMSLLHRGQRLRWGTALRLALQRTQP